MTAHAKAICTYAHITMKIHSSTSSRLHLLCVHGTPFNAKNGAYSPHARALQRRPASPTVLRCLIRTHCTAALLIAVSAAALRADLVYVRVQLLLSWAAAGQV